MYTQPVSAGNIAAQQHASPEMQQLQQIFANKVATQSQYSTPNTQPGLLVASLPQQQMLQQQQTLLQQQMLHQQTLQQQTLQQQTSSAQQGLLSGQQQNFAQSAHLERFQQPNSFLPNATLSQFSNVSGMETLYSNNAASLPVMSNSLREGTNGPMLPLHSLPQATRSLSDIQDFIMDNTKYMHSTADTSFSTAGLLKQQQVQQALKPAGAMDATLTGRVVLFIDQPQSNFVLVEQDLRVILSHFASIKSIQILKDRPAAEVCFVNPLAVAEVREDLDNLNLPSIGVLRCLPLHTGETAENYVAMHSTVSNSAGRTQLNASDPNISSIPALHSVGGDNFRAPPSHTHSSDTLPDGNYDKVRNKVGNGELGYNASGAPTVTKKVCWLEIMDIFGYDPEFDVMKLLLGHDNANIDYIMKEVNDEVELYIHGQPENSVPTEDRLHVLIVSENVAAYRHAVDLVEDLIRNIIVQFFDFAGEYGYAVPEGIFFRRHEYNGSADGSMSYLGALSSPRISSEDVINFASDGSGSIPHQQPHPLPQHHSMTQMPPPSHNSGFHGRRSRSPPSHRRGSNAMGHSGTSGRDRDRRGLGVLGSANSMGGGVMGGFPHMGHHPPSASSTHTRGNSPRSNVGSRRGGTNHVSSAPRFHMNPRGSGPRG